MLYVFYLTQQVLGICTFVYVNYKMGFLFKIGIFTLFYTAKWWIGVLVLQTGRSVKRSYSQNIDCKSDIMESLFFFNDSSEVAVYKLKSDSSPPSSLNCRL